MGEGAHGRTVQAGQMMFVLEVAWIAIVDDCCMLCTSLSDHLTISAWQPPAVLGTKLNHFCHSIWPAQLASRSPACLKVCGKYSKELSFV